ncbi:MAG: hypothetical protein H6863_04945 [Rhodospirillales bacterium]|nr:hypothetical protein [Rhodospirillales bacterium]
MTMKNYNQTFYSSTTGSVSGQPVCAKDRERLLALFDYEIPNPQTERTGPHCLQWDELKSFYAGDTASENPVLQGLEAAFVICFAESFVR